MKSFFMVSAFLGLVFKFKNIYRKQTPWAWALQNFNISVYTYIKWRHCVTDSFIISGTISKLQTFSFEKAVCIVIKL